jgi:hypothetical protein
MSMLPSLLRTPMLNFVKQQSLRCVAVRIHDDRVHGFALPARKPWLHGRRKPHSSDRRIDG